MLKTIAWPRKKFVPLDVEQSILPVLLPTKAEFGMMCLQNAHRVEAIRAECSRLGLPMDSALSLRKHHIRKNHKGRNENALQLGTQKDIAEAAELFEGAIAAHLTAGGIGFLREDAQRAMNTSTTPSQPDAPKPPSIPTPDFLLTAPMAIEWPELLEASWTQELRIDSDGVHYTEDEFTLEYRDGGRAWAAAVPRAAHAGGPLHWVEAKHYYGASTIPMDNRSAVGKLFTVVDKYVSRFGPGAICLGVGCSEPLAAALEARGALVLDQSPLDMGAVDEQMRTWCCAARESGELLP